MTKNDRPQVEIGLLVTDTVGANWVRPPIADGNRMTKNDQTAGGKNMRTKFEEKRQHLKNLSDEELKTRFWELGEQIVEPFLEMGKMYTSPSIERSILLRMGFSSLEANKIVSEVEARGLMGKGAGHVVYRLAKMKKMDIREAGVALYEGQYWDEVVAKFADEKDHSL